MPRKPRVTQAEYVYHVLNRATKQTILFNTASDYCAFEQLLGEARSHIAMRILAYCLMPNHWHLLLWPFADGDLSRFVKWLSTTHAVRWNRAHDAVGRGAVYQSRFKSIPIQTGPHLFWVWRYIERNPLRASLVRQARDWRWNSLSQRISSSEANFLDNGSIRLPSDWETIVNVPQTPDEIKAFRQSVTVGKPYGCEGWLAPLVRKRGRPARLRKP